MTATDEKTQIRKSLTGIKGLDEVTYGGLPFGRPTLITGYAGSGKTVLAMQFILNGIKIYNEPGVFISMEESEDDLRKNMGSLGYDLAEMEKINMLCIENISIRQNMLHHSGGFDLSPLFIRIEEAIKKVKAKRIVIDTFELIFNDIQDENIFRQELMRLIIWLKQRELTVIFTAENQGEVYPKSGIEEFITDCVISLKHIVIDNIYTRKFHILKYRGSHHGTNEYPFIINNQGISILPITTVETHRVSSEVISTGVFGLDDEISKKGFYVGSSTLISGRSGTGKTSLAFSICMEAMKENKKSLYFTFEESVTQLKRNLLPLGFDLDHFEKSGLLKIISTRPTLFGLESHLVAIYDYIEQFNPEIVVFDPVTDMIQIGTKNEVRGVLLRIIDYLKSNLVSMVFTALLSSGNFERDLGLSSLVDNWIKLETFDTGRKIEPGISIVKIRGMKHSHSQHILEFTDSGLKIRELVKK